MSAFSSHRRAAGELVLLLAGVAFFVPAIAADAPAAKAPAKAAVKPARKAVVVEAPIADASPDQVKAADLVFYGLHDCEFQQTVNVTQSIKHPAYVDVKSGKSTWLMKPVLSSTGALRLEDVRGETLMVQIASKSMLLNVKSAQRIVDECLCAKHHELIAEAKAARAASQAAPIKLLEEAATRAAPVTSAVTTTTLTK